MAGPGFVGPTRAQYGQSAQDRLQQGMDSIKQLGNFLEAQRQFNDTEKRLNRTLNAQMFMTIFDNLLNSTETKSMREVAEKFGPALSAGLQTWGLSAQESAGLIDGLVNTEYTGEEAMRGLYSLSLKYAEGGTSRDLMKEAQDFISRGAADAAGIGATPASTTTAAADTTAAASAPSSASTEPAGTPPPITKAPPTQLGGGTANVIERAKMVVASNRQQEGKPAGYDVSSPELARVPLDEFKRGLTTEEQKRVDEWTKDPNGLAKFLQEKGTTFVQGPGMVTRNGVPRTTSPTQDIFRKPPTQEDLAAVRNMYGRQGTGKPPASQTPSEPPVQRPTAASSNAPSALKDAAIKGEETAAAATASLGDAINALMSNPSLASKAAVQEAYSGMKLSWSPKVLFASKLSDEQVKEYLQYYRGRMNDPQYAMADLAAADPATHAKLLVEVQQSNNPTATLNGMADYLSAYGRLIEAGNAPEMARLKLEEQGWKVEQAKYDAAKTLTETKALQILPPALYNAMGTLLGQITEQEEKLMKEGNKEMQSKYQEQIVSLKNLFNQAAGQASKWIADNTGMNLAFPPLTEDTKTFDHWNGLFKGTTTFTVQGTQATPARTTPAAAPTASASAQALDSKWNK